MTAVYVAAWLLLTPALALGLGWLLSGLVPRKGLHR